jgi:predicted DCC family thiol-disulfide oxidoreductase YuxK
VIGDGGTRTPAQPRKARGCGNTPLPLLYDGGSGFCFRWVHFWEKVIERRGFSLKDLQSAWEDGSLKSSQEKLLDDILVLTRDGNLVSGANAYLFMARRIWWA